MSNKPIIDTNDEEDMFRDDTLGGGYKQLPVEANYLRWKRGNAQLGALMQVDPAIYFGGWGASVVAMREPHDPLPFVPFPIVERRSSDGKVSYQRYASTRVKFQFILARVRFELWSRLPDGSKGEDLLAISRKFVEGYTPMKQVFGLAFTDDMTTSYPVVLKLDTWSAYISFNKAEEAYAKIKTQPGRQVLRIYGTVGDKDNKGTVIPKFVEFNKGMSTPIEGLNLKTPEFLDVTDEVKQLWRDARDWKDCPLWNSDVVFDEVEDEGEVDAQSAFAETAAKMNLSADEQAALLKENDNDFARALDALGGVYSD